MGLFFRTLFIWLLVLAVPAQGAAAATMAFCGPNHQGSGSARVEFSATVSKHSHHGDAEFVHEVRSGASATTVVADDASAVAKASQAAKQKCSACASCCTMGAILTAVPVVSATDSAPTVFTTVVPTVDAFAADGPDRPPRNVLV
ncbi:MAG: hypothetical protein Q7U26_18600 [Aquabacterium sp.]|nr:hypothetical protein [Aquabacterium sp.]